MFGEGTENSISPYIVNTKAFLRAVFVQLREEDASRTTREVLEETKRLTGDVGILDYLDGVFKNEKNSETGRFAREQYQAFRSCGAGFCGNICAGLWMTWGDITKRLEKGGVM